jgi:hypothetical protein
MPDFDEFMKKLDRANSVAGHFWSAVEMSQMYRDEGYKDGTSDGMGTAALAFARQGIQIMQPACELAREFAEGEHVEATQLVDTVAPRQAHRPHDPAASCNRR